MGGIAPRARAAAAVVAAVLLALEIAEPPLADLARQSINASNGSVPAMTRTRWWPRSRAGSKKRSIWTRSATT
jgi:hypothetical protein